MNNSNTHAKIHRSLYFRKDSLPARREREQRTNFLKSCGPAQRSHGDTEMNTRRLLLHKFVHDLSHRRQKCGCQEVFQLITPQLSTTQSAATPCFQAAGKDQGFCAQHKLPDTRETRCGSSEPLEMNP